MAKSTSYVPENCKGIIDGLKALGNKHSIWNVFEDWLKVSSIAISNSVDWNQANEREEQYLETINKYTPEEQKVLTKTFAELVNALQKEAETGGPCDLLARSFMPWNFTISITVSFLHLFISANLWGRLL